ncbi:MAG TPA: type IV toxin-antitoxin system AbiEi family antitoxin domain-containing protein [Candidatus Acidoferrales bacterium]|nr:type IV toxin-antitoxin system AbiEi family antitoxin domain-containing protein [Candidatus Acidoferrales bacterium]
MRHMKEMVETFSKAEYPVFTAKDVSMALKGSGISADYLYLMLHNLMKKGSISRITRGVYTFSDDVAAAGFAFQPFYYGLESALWLRGISGQGANFVVMTPRNVRTGVRDFKGRNYRVQRIPKELMFGYELLRYGKFWVPVSDLEKTVLDIAVLGYQMSDDILPEIMKKLDRAKLRRYVKMAAPHLSKGSAERCSLLLKALS